MATPKKTVAKTSAIKQANELKISTVGDFKKRIGGIFELPSGMVVRLRNPGGLAVFLSSGTIPNSLMSVVTKALKNNQAGVDVENNPEVAAELESIIDEDPQALAQMSIMMDSIAVKCMIEPLCHPVPADGEERSEDLLYADEVELQDKQFMFRWISSGVKDLEPFRKGSK